MESISLSESFSFGGHHGEPAIDTANNNPTDTSSTIPGGSAATAEQGFAAKGPGSTKGNQPENYDEIAIAAQFADDFNPVPNVNYDWLLDQAKNYYWTIDKDAENIDAKANSIISYYGAGTGLLVVAATVAACEGKIPASVGWWFAPAVICGLAAIVLALFSRWPRPWGSTPGTPAGSRYIKHYVDIKRADGSHYNDLASASKMAEYITIGTWHHSAVENSMAVRDKTKWLNLAYIASAASVVLLFLPFLAAMIKKC